MFFDCLHASLIKMCTEESYANIHHSVEQFKFLAVEKRDGLQTVLSTIIKVSRVHH